MGGVLMEITYKEAAALERWNRLKLWSYCYYRPTDAIPLAKKGLITIVGWSDGIGEKKGHGITWGESVPERYRLIHTSDEPHRPLLEAYDKDGKRLAPSMRACCVLTDLGRSFISKYSDNWRSRMVPNRKGPDPLIKIEK